MKSEANSSTSKATHGVCEKQHLDNSERMFPFFLDVELSDNEIACSKCCFGCDGRIPVSKLIDDGQDLHVEKSKVAVDKAEVVSNVSTKRRLDAFPSGKRFFKKKRDVSRLPRKEIICVDGAKPKVVL